MTSLTLQKDALEDECEHLRSEMEEIRHHLDRVSTDNAELSGRRAELEATVERMEAEVQKFRETGRFVKQERDEMEAMLDELKRDHGSAVISTGI